jgi:hypothetical protein
MSRKKIGVGASKFNLQKECQKVAPKMFKELIATINNPGRHHSPVKLNAIKEVLDRGFGRAKESVELSGDIVVDLKRKQSPNVSDGKPAESIDNQSVSGNGK